MHYSDLEIVFQEVPGQISICYTVSGCNLKCENCHSPHLWKKGYGTELTKSDYLNTLSQYKNLATCVLFMGGEWDKQNLTYFLKLAKSEGYKTCLYTGEDSIDDKLLAELTWLKTGKWNDKLGGLSNPLTNQKFIEVQTNKLLNYLFIN